MPVMLNCYFCYIVYNEKVDYQMIDSLNKKIYDNVENVEFSIEKDSIYTNLVSIKITIESRNPDIIFDNTMGIIFETNPVIIHFGYQEDSYSTGEVNFMGVSTLVPTNRFNDYIEGSINDFFL